MRQTHRDNYRPASRRSDNDVITTRAVTYTHAPCSECRNKALITKIYVLLPYKKCMHVDVRALSHSFLFPRIALWRTAVYLLVLEVLVGGSFATRVVHDQLLLVAASVVFLFIHPILPASTFQFHLF